MPGTIIRPAYSKWPDYNRALRDVVAGLTAEQLALQPSPDRWPLWASIGHLCCQRVFWLCVFGNEPGAEWTPFPNSGFDCPGDDDLVNVRSSKQLVEDIDSTFAIVERCLDTWTLESLSDVITHPEHGDDRRYSRGSIIQRVFAHDIAHATELNETLSREGLALVDFWD